MIAELAAGIYQFFSNAFSALFSFLGNILSGLFNAVKALLNFLFEPILAFFGTIFYFLYKLGSLVMKVINLVYDLVVFFVSIMKGLFLTLIGLSYNGQTAQLPGRYQDIMNHIQPALAMVQMDKIAVLCLWSIWIFIGVAIVKIIGSRT